MEVRSTGIDLLYCLYALVLQTLSSGAGGKVAGFKAWHILKVISDVSIGRAWYLVNQPPISQWCPLISGTV